MFEPLSSVMRLHRERQGLTIDALAVLAGVSRTRVIALEKGTDNVSLEILVKLATALQVTEVPVGGLGEDEAPPETELVGEASAALDAARKVIEQARQALATTDAAEAELERVIGLTMDLTGPLLESRDAMPALPEGEPSPRQMRGRG